METMSSPFPIHADSTNVTRIDPEEPIHKTGIYRGLWERKPLGDDDGAERSRCAAFNSLDYISLGDFKSSQRRCWARQREIDARFEAQLDEEIAAEELEKNSEMMNFADIQDSD